MFERLAKTGMTPVEILQKQVSNSVSMFTTILENLKKSQDSLNEQMSLRDSEIKKLTDERQVLSELYSKNTNIIDKINNILA